MKKLLTKTTVLFIALISIVGLFAPLSLSARAEGVSNDIQNSNNSKYEETMVETAEQLSTYFGLDENGDVTFNVDKDTLVKELGISEEDAVLMLGASEELPKETVSNQMQARGFVGIYMNLGPKVRKMSGWAAGAFAGGYVGWYAKQFAVNPITAGVAALITGSATFSAKYAVENGIRRISLGRNIAGWSMSYNINIP